MSKKAGTSFDFKWESLPTVTISPKAKNLEPKILGATAAIFKREELIATADMKKNAPWTDRSGNARNGLTAISRVDGKTFTLTLFHRVPYGIYLETRWQGKYRIIVPTLGREQQRITMLLQKLITKLGAIT